jgi:hypothetical protein
LLNAPVPAVGKVRQLRRSHSPLAFRQVAAVETFFRSGIRFCLSLSPATLLLQRWHVWLCYEL